MLPKPLHVFAFAFRSLQRVGHRESGEGHENLEPCRTWRRYPLFGKPDFVFRAEKVAVFVDGEFWHGHPTRAKIPATNRVFWEKKIARNKARDQEVNRVLKEKKWTVTTCCAAIAAPRRWRGVALFAKRNSLAGAITSSF